MVFSYRSFCCLSLSCLIWWRSSLQLCAVSARLYRVYFVTGTTSVYAYVFVWL